MPRQNWVTTPLAPWHMWGTSVNVTVPHPSSSGAEYRQSTQLTRINYKRPDNWRFLLAAIIRAAPDAGANPVNIYVDFYVYTGVGRSRIELTAQQGKQGSGFAHFNFQYATPGSSVIGLTKWATSVPGPDLDDSAPEHCCIDLIPGQDIQCGASVATLAADATDVPTIVEVHAYFAPNVHVRPDWFTESPKLRNLKFTGSETGGT